MGKVKEDLLNSVIAFLKGREIVFKAFENAIFSKLKDNSKQSEQSEQLINYNAYISLKSDNDSNTSNDTSFNNLSSDSDALLFTST